MEHLYVGAIGYRKYKSSYPGLERSSSRRTWSSTALIAATAGLPRSPGRAKHDPPDDQSGRGILDLAAVFRPSAGDDITSQSSGVSSRRETLFACLGFQSTAAAAEEWGAMAKMAAQSSPASGGDRYWNADLSPLAIVAFAKEFVRGLGRVPLCHLMKRDVVDYAV